MWLDPRPAVQAEVPVMPRPARVTPGEQRQDHQSEPFGVSVTAATETPNGYLILVLLSSYFGAVGKAGGQGGRAGRGGQATTATVGAA
jgi:hypothetical protein